ncbi:MAG: cytochrome c, partial [Chloroflexota bacterium]|nr:cytochrome c [Chloroflexota bacterium]
NSGGSTGSASTTTGSPAAAGGETYARYCNTCHPGGNRGAGPSLIQRSPRMSDEEIRSVIRNGQQRMPGFNAQLISDDQLTGLVAYIRTLK